MKKQTGRLGPKEAKFRWLAHICAKGTGQGTLALAPLILGTEFGTLFATSIGDNTMPFVENTLPRPKMSEDVIPFTEYRRTLSDCLERTKRTHRPLFITQNGRATTVVMNIAEYEQHEDVIAQYQAHLDRIHLSRDIEISRREFAEGHGIALKQLEQDSAAFLNSLVAREVNA